MSASPVNAAVTISADRRIDAYQLLHEGLGGTPYETPDCAHSEFGPHITQAFDVGLNRDVFLFHLHLEHDNDRCLRHDRQRVEIKTYGRSGRRLLGHENETHTYRWKFRLDENFSPSPSWNHLFQVAPVGNGTPPAPILTLSVKNRTASGERLLIRHDDGSGIDVLHEVALEPFKGIWIDATVEVFYNIRGSVRIQLMRVVDREVLLHWRAEDINTFRDGTQFNRPKWGNYRSLWNTHGVRDEVVRFNDFCIAEGSDTCPDILPPPRAFVPRLDIEPFPSGEPLLREHHIRTLETDAASQAAAENRTSPRNGRQSERARVVAPMHRMTR